MRYLKLKIKNKEAPTRITKETGETHTISPFRWNA